MTKKLCELMMAEERSKKKTKKFIQTLKEENQLLRISNANLLLEKTDLEDRVRLLAYELEEQRIKYARLNRRISQSYPVLGSVVFVN